MGAAQAAGPEYVEADKLNVNHYCLKPGIEQKLDAMLTGKLSIYDNDFGTNWEDVLNTIYDWVKENNASVAIIDNLMALDLPHRHDGQVRHADAHRQAFLSDGQGAENSTFTLSAILARQKPSRVKGTSAAPPISPT